MNQAFGISAVKRYRPLLANESLLLLKRILADPSDYMGYIRRCACLSVQRHIHPC